MAVEEKPRARDLSIAPIINKSTTPGLGIRPGIFNVQCDTTSAETTSVLRVLLSYVYNTLLLMTAVK